MDEFRQNMPRWQLVEKEVLKIIKEAELDTGNCHAQDYFFIHIPMVIAVAQMLAQKRGLREDIAICIAALHDIGEIVDKERERHAERAVPHAQKMLERVGKFSEEEKKIILSAVAKHSNKAEIDGPYDELIKDADVFASWLLIKDELQGPRLERLEKVKQVFAF